MSRGRTPPDGVRPDAQLSRVTVGLICIALVAALGWTVAGQVWPMLQKAPAKPLAVRAQRNIDVPLPQPLPDVGVSPLVFTYHDVHPGADGRYNITPARFAQDMASLHAAGWRTIDTARYLDWLYGRVTLPPRTMLITFDDGASGSWIYADSILRHFDYQAVAFVVTGFIGRGDYYLTWAELRKLKQTGRWNIESHTHLGHVAIPSDAKLRESPFMINRRWTRDGLESLAAFQQRVTRDLERNIQTLRQEGFELPRLFAYPFGASRFPANDPAAAALTAGQVRGLFRGAMTEITTHIGPVRPDPYEVLRLGATSDVELPALFDRQLSKR